MSPSSFVWAKMCVVFFYSAPATTVPLDVEAQARRVWAVPWHMNMDHLMEGGGRGERASVFLLKKRDKKGDRFLYKF